MVRNSNVGAGFLLSAWLFNLPHARFYEVSKRQP